jgi:hypothetical protein
MPKTESFIQGAPCGAVDKDSASGMQTAGVRTVGALLERAFHAAERRVRLGTELEAPAIPTPVLSGNATDITASGRP